MNNQKNNQIAQTCIHHKVPFTYFCESCEEPVCQQCTTLGPHNYNLHRINQLSSAFQLRVEHISEEVKNNLLPRREEILAQIHRIEYRIQEIKYMTTLIERDCRAEMNGIIDRLNQAEGIKQAKLQNQIQTIQKDLDEMNDLAIKFFELVKEQDYLQFLFESQELLDRIEFQIAKPSNQGLDETSDDLPRELTDLRLQLGKLEGQKKMLEILNEIIWRMLSEKKFEEDCLQGVLSKEADKEVKEWSKLVDFFADQLKENQLVCYFCNCQLGIESINRKCKKNKEINDLGNLLLNILVIGFSKEKPNDQQKGTNKHYFGHSIEGSRKMPSIIEDTQTKKPTGIMIEAIVSKIKIRISEKNINLEKIFGEHDDEKDGIVNQIVFYYILQEHLSLIDEEIENLIDFMDCGEQINYNTFMLLLRNNEAIRQQDVKLMEKYKPMKFKKRGKL